MMHFEEEYFKKFNFSKKQIDKFLNSAKEDLDIAEHSNIPKVQFQFAYNYLIKVGIALIACFNYKVSSRKGHHRKILEKVAKILKDRDILLYSNEMRRIRNLELYDGGVLITNKQAGEFLHFVKRIHKLSQKFFKEHFNALL